MRNPSFPSEKPAKSVLSASSNGETRVRLMTVADLHQRSDLVAPLRKAVAEQRPDALVFLGDALDMTDAVDALVPLQDWARILAGLEVPECHFVRGNHKDSNWIEFAEAWTSMGRPLSAVHREAMQIGPMTWIGFPCRFGTEDYFTLGRNEPDSTPRDWLAALLRRVGPRGRCLWLIHEPPLGRVGCPEWKEAVERYLPWLVVSGHDHDAAFRTGRWSQRLGNTHCVNVGQRGEATLAYTVIEAVFDSASATMPRSLTVHAFPHGGSIRLPEG